MHFGPSFFSFYCSLQLNIQAKVLQYRTIFPRLLVLGYWTTVDSIINNDHCVMKNGSTYFLNTVASREIELTHTQTHTHTHTHTQVRLFGFRCYFRVQYFVHRQFFTLHKDEGRRRSQSWGSWRLDYFGKLSSSKCTKAKTPIPSCLIPFFHPSQEVVLESAFGWGRCLRVWVSLGETWQCTRPTSPTPGDITGWAESFLWWRLIIW